MANQPAIVKQNIYKMFEKEFAAAKMICAVENIFEDAQLVIMQRKDPKRLRGWGFFHIVNGIIIFQRGYWEKLTMLKQNILHLE